MTEKKPIYRGNLNKHIESMRVLSLGFELAIEGP